MHSSHKIWQNHGLTPSSSVRPNLFMLQKLQKLWSLWTLKSKVSSRSTSAIIPAQFIRTLLARCFIEVDSQIIPGRSSTTERIWGRSTAASCCHYDSCPLMLPRARKSKHNWPFWSLRVRLTWRCCFPKHTLAFLSYFSYLCDLFFFFNTHKFNKNSVFQGLVCQPISSWQNCGRDSCRKLHICWGFHVNCQQNMNGIFFCCCCLMKSKRTNEYLKWQFMRFSSRQERRDMWGHCWCWITLSMDIPDALILFYVCVRTPARCAGTAPAVQMKKPVNLLGFGMHAPWPCYFPAGTYWNCCCRGALQAN